MRISRRVLYLILCLCMVMFFNACIVARLLPYPRLDPGEIYYPAPEDDFVRIDTDVPDVQMHYRYYPGEGNKVVLIHGFASSTYTWEDMVTVFRKKYTDIGKKPPAIWAIDMKGFGWSDKPIGAKYDPLALTDDVNKWMIQMGIANATVVGNSLGGGVAGILAIDHPDKVANLVLIDAGGYPVKNNNNKFFSNIPLICLSAEILFTRQCVEEVLHSVFYDPGKVTETRIDAYFNRMRTKGALDSQFLMVKSLGSQPVLDYSKRIKEIKKPTLIIWGRDDPWIPVDIGIQFRCDLENSKLVIIPESGHVSQEEHPAKVAELLYQFLKGLPIESVTPVCPE